MKLASIAVVAATLLLAFPQPIASEDRGVWPPSTDVWLPVPTGEIRRIAFGSCSNQYLPQPIWKTLIAARPDVFIYQGDVIYGDAAPPGGTGLIPPAVDRLAKMRIDYQYLAANPDFVELQKNVPMMSTWDDHDYGRNDGGNDFALKEQTRQLHLDFFGVATGSERRTTQGLYYTETCGPPGRRTQIIMLDTRYFRDPLKKSGLSREEATAQNIVGRYAPHDDSTRTLLGEKQWKWLEKELRKPADVRLLNSSIQVVAGEKGAEGWSNFPHERRRLYDLIAKTGASGVILLTGDVHFAELSKTIDGPYPLYDFTATPLAQYPTGSTGWEKCVNSFRIAGPYEKDNFGVVEIDWDAKPSPRILLKLIGVDGTTAFQYAIDVQELQVNQR